MMILHLFCYLRYLLMIYEIAIVKNTKNYELHKNFLLI